MNQDHNPSGQAAELQALRQRVAMLEDSLYKCQSSLKEAEQDSRLYMELVDQAVDAILLGDPQGNITGANQSATVMSGYPHHELIGMNIGKFFSVEEQQRVPLRYDLLKAGKVIRNERILTRKDGSLLDIEMNSRMMPDGSYHTFVRDISARKCTERELQEREAQLRTVFETSHAGILLVDADGVITFANSRMAEMFGRNLEELIGTTYPEYLHPSERRTGDNRMRLLIAGDIDHVGNERHYLRADGSDFWGYLSGRRLLDEAGRFRSLVGVITDISDHKLAEEARNRVLEFSETLLASSPLGVRVFDGVSGDCVLANQAAAVIAGGSREDLLRQNFRQLASWREVGFDQLAEAVLADGVVRRSEQLLKSSLGHQGWVIYSFSRFLVEGEPQLLVLGQDVSAEKRLDAEKQQIEMQLLHAQKLESLGLLAGGIAHDFNNLLMAVLGHSELALRRLQADSPAQKNLQQIKLAASKAADLANQMLAYSGKGRFVVEPLELNPLIADMAQLLEVSVSKKAQLVYALAASLPSVEGDASQLRQIILNLVINASEAIGAERGKITLRTDVVDCAAGELISPWQPEGLPAGRYVCFEVRDTGCGISPENRPRIFEPFFSTKPTGRGLGMAAVQGIVRGHRGAITLESEAGQGTVFRVWLPVSGQRIATAVAEPRLRAERGSGLVLLVDDDETVREAAREMLQELGFSVLEAVDGEQAVELFRQHRDEILVVLMDLTMPQLDGKEALRAMQAIDPQARIILSSGYNEQELPGDILHQTHSVFLKKPYTFSALQSALQQCLGRTEPPLL